MTTSSLDEQARSYVDDGYLVVRDLVSKQDIDAICEELMRFARGEYPSMNRDQPPADHSDEEMLKTQWQHRSHYPSLS